jgi:hypothetical protein
MAAVVHGMNKPTFNFVPTSIAGCALWLDASDSNAFTFAGSTITQWRDRSPFGNNTDTVSGTPTYALNATINRFGVLLSSSAYFLGPLSNNTTFLTAFVVGTMNSVAGTTSPLLACTTPPTTASSNVVPFARSTTLQQIQTYRNSAAQSTISITFGTPFVASTTFNNTNNVMFRNGNAGSTTTTGATGTFNYTRYGVGFDPALVGNRWNGYVHEIIVYHALLTTYQRQQVEGYLAWKWNTSGGSWTAPFPTSVPYYKSPIYGRPFDPPTASNLVAWFDGADPSTISVDGSSRVTSWRDKRTLNGTGAPYTEPAGSTVYRGPIYSASDASLYFDNANLSTKTTNQAGLRLMAFSNTTIARRVFLTQTSGAAIRGNVVCFAVFYNDRPTTTTNNALFDFCDAATPTFRMVGDIGMGAGPTYRGPFITGGATTISFTSLSAWSTTGSWSIGTFLFTPSSTTVRMNGTQYATTAGTAVTLSQVTLLTMGAHIDSRTFTGRIREFLCYDIMSLSDPTGIQQVEGYLAHKWNLQSVLPATHSFKTIPPIVPSIANQIVTNFGNVGAYNKYGDFRWRMNTQNGGNQPNGVATDSYGNVYVAVSTGAYSVWNANDTLFQTITGLLNLTAFLISYYSSGYVRWVAYYEQTGNDFGFSVTTDFSDNIIIGGSTASGVRIVNANQTISTRRFFTSATGGVPNMTFKFDNDGSFFWVGANTTGGNTTWATPGGLVTNRFNDVYTIANQDNPSITVYDASGTNIVTLNRVGNASPSVVRYNSSGGVLHYTRAGATTFYCGFYGSPRNQFSVAAAGIGVDSSSNIFFGGYFTGTPFSAYNHPGTVISGQITNSGTTNSCIVKYTSNLSVVALAKIGGTLNDFVYFVGVDTSSGNVYACGTFTSSTLSFFNANGTTGGAITRSSATRDAFLVKYTNTLSFTWALRMAGPASSITTLKCLVVDPVTGEILVGGDATGSPVNFFEPGQTHASYVFSKQNAAGSSNVFHARIDPVTADVRYVREYGTIGGANAMVAPTFMAVDSNGNWYTTTGYNQSVNATKYYFNAG